MNRSPIEFIPISEIDIVNPRPRNKLMFETIVRNIAAIGLKKPITVCRRQGSSDGAKYDLVCGQGRLEAFLALGEKVIPAIIIEATRATQYLMSLVENIARHPPSNRDLPREVRSLMSRGYKTDQIASKLGLDRVYTYGIMKLLEQGGRAIISLWEWLPGLGLVSFLRHMRDSLVRRNIRLSWTPKTPRNKKQSYQTATVNLLSCAYYG